VLYPCCEMDACLCDIRILAWSFTPPKGLDGGNPYSREKKAGWSVRPRPTLPFGSGRPLRSAMRGLSVHPQRAVEHELHLELVEVAGPLELEHPGAVAVRAEDVPVPAVRESAR